MQNPAITSGDGHAPHPLSLVRGEFIWDGKYDEAGQRRMPSPDSLACPLRVHEVIHPVQLDATSGPQGNEGYVCAQPPAGRLIHGDNRVVMSSLRARYAGAIDLIYLDPPFDIGTNFSMRPTTGDGIDPVTVHAYSDQWSSGPGSYAQVLHDQLVLARDLLSDRGSIYVHGDWHANWIIRAVLNDVFGAEQFRNEIAWCYTSPGRNATRFKPCHDTIFYFSRNDSPIWNRPQQPLAPATLSVERLRFAGQEQEWVRSRTTKDMVDWWDIPFPTGSGERTGYPTQKPVALLRRIIEASSEPDSLVADMCCGSGTFGVAAEQAGRRWVLCDAGAVAVHIARRRLTEACADSGHSFTVEHATGHDRGGSLRVEASAQVHTSRSEAAVLEVELRACGTDAESPIAFVDSWAVALDSGDRTHHDAASVSPSSGVPGSIEDEVFVPIWHAFRARRSRHLSTVARIPLHTACSIDQVRVKVMDVWGNAGIATVPVCSHDNARLTV